jgi:hypothetical protein
MAGVTSLLGTEELKAWLDTTQTAKVERFLREHRIPHWRTRSGPVTTLEAINARLLGAASEEEFNFGQEA